MLVSFVACGGTEPAPVTAAPPPPVATTPPPPPPVPAKLARGPRPEWMGRSDTNAQLLLDLETRFSPEGATQAGVETVDTEISDLTPGFRERERTAYRAVKTDLEQRRARESDPLVRQDLTILLHAVDLRLRAEETEERLMVPFWPVPRMIFNGMHTLLDEQISPARRQKALARLQKYVGVAPGTKSFAELAEADSLRALGKPGLTMPSRADVEKIIATSGELTEGVAKLFDKYKLADSPEAKQALAALKTQSERYAKFLKDRMLPKARTTIPLPPAVYELRLEEAGVDLPPSELTRMAHAEFLTIQAEMQKVAAEVAKARNLPSADYRDVIKALKKEQITGDAIMPHYQARLAEIEGIIRKENLVTLPDRPARMRLGSPAESANQPAPHMVPPRLVGNTGEEGEFVLPLSISGPTGGDASGKGGSQYDDFTYPAASWTLTSHEVRPGHELQFDTMVERGVTLARGRYAFNSANAEGWGLYSEMIMLPFMPPEGKLVSLDFRLHRAARAFLDPELQQGKWTFDSAREFLEKEVGLSHAFATAEVERYTFRMPGQATSYYYGLVRLRGLRKEAEEALGDRFNARQFHDTILDQGLLPPDLMRVAVLGALGVPVK